MSSFHQLAPILASVCVCATAAAAKDGGVERIDARRTVALLNEFAAKYASLKSLGTEAQNDKMVKYFEGRRELEAFGKGAGGVWARLVDGRTLVLENQAQYGSSTDGAPTLPVLPSPDTAGAGAGGSPPAAASAATQNSRYYGVPATNLACMFGTTGSSAWLRQAANYLQKKGWRTEGNTANATVAELMAVRGCGVLALDAHASDMALGRSGRVYSIYTATRVNDDDEEYFIPYVVSGDLAYYHPVDGEFHYAITDKGVRRWWRMSSNSFAYLNICRGSSDVAAAMRKVILSPPVGASVYASWTKRSMDGIGGETAAFVFDRLLGTNLYEGGVTRPVPKEKPPQRPFPWDQVEVDMHKNGLGLFPDTKYGGISQLKFESGGRSDFGLLAPSIETLGLDDEKDELILYGRFGYGSESVKVYVAGEPHSLAAPMSRDELHVKIPRTGPGSSGAVYVEVNGLKSNVARLTAWKGKLEYTVTGGPNRGLTQKWTFDVRFRGDVRNVRTFPGRPPENRMKILSLMRDSKVEYEMKGQDFDARYRTTWKGQGTLQHAMESSDPNKKLTSTAFVNKDDQTRVWFDLVASTNVAFSERMERWDNDHWVDMGSHDRPEVLPLQELMRGGYFHERRLRDAAPISEKGDISGYSSGKVKSPSFHTWWTDTNFKFEQELKWEDFKIEPGSAPAPDDEV